MPLERAFDPVNICNIRTNAENQIVFPNSILMNPLMPRFLIPFDDTAHDIKGDRP
jgi:hypothetical protein